MTEGAVDSPLCVCVCVCVFLVAQLCPTLCDPRVTWAVGHQASLSMGFSGQKYWSGLPFPPPQDLANPESKPTSPMSPALQVVSLPVNH